MSNASLLRHWHDAAKILEEIWSRTHQMLLTLKMPVLILVVVEYGLRPLKNASLWRSVLILVVVEYGLRLFRCKI